MPALRDVSLEVAAGEILGIAGVEGNGQSQLVECLTGLLKPTSGSITIDDVEIAGMKPARNFLSWLCTRAGRQIEDGGSWSTFQ